MSANVSTFSSAADTLPSDNALLPIKSIGAARFLSKNSNLLEAYIIETQLCENIQLERQNVKWNLLSNGTIERQLHEYGARKVT